MSVEIRRRLLIDRISVLAVIGSDLLYKIVYAQLHGMEDEQAILHPKGKAIVRHEKYSTRLDWYAEYTHKKAGRRKVADIELGATKKSGQKALWRYLRLTLYPSQFRAGDLDRFRSVFDPLMADITYAGLFANGKVTYLELASDSHSHKHHSFLPYRAYVAKSRIYKEPDGYHGSTYVGSSTSNLHFRIYDKRKQLQDTGKATMTKILPHTRIEAVLRRVGGSPANLLGLANPFGKLQIADLAKAKKLFITGEQPAFLSDCLSMGVPDALALRSKHERAKYRKMLDSIPVTWWNPVKVWADLPLALAVIAP